MSTFIETTDTGCSLVVNDRGDRIPLDGDMKIDFENMEGARVRVERRDGFVICAARVPESTEPITWKFDVSDDRVRTTKAPVPCRNNRAMYNAISECRVGLNGKL